MAANRDLGRYPQKILPIPPCVVRNAANHALLIQQIVAEARNRTHMNPTEHDRSTFPQNLQRRRNDLTRRRKNNRRIKLFRRRVKRIPRPLRAKLQREPTVPLVARKRINLSFPVQRNLNRKVRRRAKPIKPEPVARLHIGEPQRTKSDNSSTEQWRRLLVGETRWNRVHEIFIRNDIFRVAAVYAVARK